MRKFGREALVWFVEGDGRGGMEAEGVGGDDVGEGGGQSTTSEGEGGAD